MIAVHALLKFVHGDRLIGPMRAGPRVSPLGIDILMIVILSSKQSNYGIDIVEIDLGSGMRYCKYEKKNL